MDFGHAKISDAIFSGQSLLLSTTVLNDTTITNDLIGVEVGDGGEPRKWWVFPRVEVGIPEGLTCGPLEL